MHNLVKTFLTSITFDSLSRKIKNPCLVINKNLFQKENLKMKNSKNKKLFTYMVVGALVMALSISCKSNEEPEVNRLHSNHPPAGNYKYLNEGTATVTITSEGCNIKGEATHISVSGGGSTSSKEKKQYDITITKWYSGGDGSTDKGSFLLGNQGEATINSPATASYFYVDYYPGGISIYFDDQEKTYGTGSMTKE